MKTVDELIKTCRSLWHQCLSEPAAAVGLLCDTVWQRSDTAANLCCWYLVTSREERTVFASGFYSRSDFPGLRVHPQRDVKLTLRVRQWRDSSVCVCTLLTLNGIISLHEMITNVCVFCRCVCSFQQIIKECMNSTAGDLVTWILHVQDHFVPFLWVVGWLPGGIAYLSPGEQSE